ncbi:LOW QUALITY PROTEIN: F-box/kelch-repeat protein At1g80440-like [Dioscorea cayenensis subsp. rotundata]|uniref:LOW QUALITY PROTEIN: F-box/kelch-repeat protein At1g80440-like n=1 Tax=Dioscorea cayennensis subsp. rotundata TaxID=55577 RepID=A0AB40CTY8_DIOCR|nr:LOW QUALITY PROTEIN: F-box/kelch-repeat protein At1g80440-like [Dioscorea cayenensis subsp. rotundata]
MDDLIPGLPSDIALECLIRIPFDRFSSARSVCRSWRTELGSPASTASATPPAKPKPSLPSSRPSPKPIQSGPAHKYSTPAYRISLLQPDSATWTSLPPIPDLPLGLPLFCQLAFAGSGLVLLGGWDPASWAVSNAVFVYDFVESTWRRGTPMPGPKRSFFACSASVDPSVVYVAGGHDEDKNALKSALAYDVARDEWTQLADMAVERDECRGVFARGRFHVIGGYGTETQGRFGKSAESFDVATWKWGPVEEDKVSDGTCARTCVAGEDGRMYMCVDGHVAVEDGVTWRVVAELPERARVGQALLTWKGGLMVVASGAQFVYTLEKGGTWRCVEAPHDFSGHVQAVCCLVI